MKTYVPISLIGVVVPLLLSGCGFTNGSNEANDVNAGRDVPDIVRARSLDSTRILVEFAEPAGVPEQEPSSYLVLDSNSKKLAVHEVSLNTNRMEATLRTDNQSKTEAYTIALDGATASVPVDSSGPPRVVGAISTTNTTVIVTFSKKMNAGSEVPENYTIVQKNFSTEAGILIVMDATLLLPAKNAVKLTTLPQNELTYVVHVVNVLDTFDTPLAAPELLVDPSRATFRGTPPTCQNVCTNGSDGTDGNGACASDDNCNLDKSCDSGEIDCLNTCICSLLDTDGDGLPDHVEQAGWTVTYELTARTGLFERFGAVVLDVTSSPFLADTDGDGLSDLIERELSTNPRNTDTDHDGLGDYVEFNLYFSSPVDQDTDEDQLDDFLEVTFYKTSPILADTDGDGLDDDVEILKLNRNPRIADLPEWEIDVGDLLLQIDVRYTYTDETGETIVETSSTSASFVEENQTSKIKYNSKVLRTGWELNGKIGGSVAIGLTKVDVKTYAEISGGGFRNSDVHSGSDTTSTSSLRSAYESSLTRGRELTTTRTVTREVFGASISAPLTVRSTGDIAFTISNLELSVVQLAPDHVSYIPIATLVPSAELLTGEPTVLNLGPLLDERGPINLVTQDVFPSLVEDMMRAPRGPIIVPSNFDITDEFGRNFAFTSQEINDRTATIIIDLGDGTVEQYNVAIAGSVDSKNFIEGVDYVGGFDADGKPNGIPLDYALQDIIGLKKETYPPVYDSVTAGPNGIAETVAAGDDVQKFNTATQGLSDISVIISAGANGVLDTVVLNGDDEFAVTEGYATSLTCNEFTTQRIVEAADGEGDGMVNTVPDFDDVYAEPFASSLTCSAGSPNAEITCSSDDDCAADLSCDEDDENCENKCNAIGQSVAPGQVIILAGDNGIIDSVASGDDVQLGPGDLCDDDDQCPGLLGLFVCAGKNVAGVACTTDDDCIPVGTCLVSKICDVDSENIGAPCSVDGECTAGQPGICVSTDPLCNGSEVLRRFKNASTGSRNRMWLAYSTDQIPFGTDFGKVILKARMQILFGFEQDIDRDGLFARHEFGFGSSDREKDTDFDGISDVAEVRDGWIVDVAGREPYRAFPDPRLKDSDGDGVYDIQEMICGTDPLKRDTDDDGVSDYDELCDDGEITDDGECLGFATRCTEAPGIGSLHLDPLNPDSDGDLLLDGIEPFLCDAMGECADPLDPDDADKFLDADEDGLANVIENADKEAGGGWEVEVFKCNNTCGAAYDGDCQEGKARLCESASPNSGVSCSVDSTCNETPLSKVCVKTLECAANSPNAGDVCENNDVACNEEQPSPECNNRMCRAARPGVSCTTNDDCSIYATCVDLGIEKRCGDLTGSECDDDNDCNTICRGTCEFSDEDGANCRSDNACAQLTTNFECCNPGQTNANCGVCQSDTSRPCSQDIQCAFLATCLISLCGGAGDPCAFDPLDPLDNTCSGNCVFSDGFCMNSVNEGDFCRSNAACEALPDTDFICLPTCAAGSDCADCGPISDEYFVYSDPTLGDTDFDGLPDLLEMLIGTDPNNIDTDGDGLLDFDEFVSFGEYFQNNFLFKGFFLTDAGSQKIGTNLKKQDTDGDGLTDAFERLTGWRVLAVNDRVAREVKPSPLLADSDFDGLTDSQEYVGADGIPPGKNGDSGDATDPNDPDTDGDGILDGVEVAAGTNPLRPDLAVNISVGGLTLTNQLGSNPIAFIPEGWSFEITAEIVGQTPVVIANNQTFTQCTNDEFSTISACDSDSFYLSGFGGGAAFNVSDLDVLCPANQTLTVVSGDILVIRTRIEGSTCFPLPVCLSESTKVYSFTDLQSAGFEQLVTDLGTTGVPGIEPCEGKVILELIRQ